MSDAADAARAPGRLPEGGLIDRAAPCRFVFNGKQHLGYRGDTLASALLASGVTLVARSVKYHRPRGIYAAGAEEPSALVQVGHGAASTPNLRATQTELYDGLQASSVNCWPGPRWDVGAVNGLFGRLMPAGFYYKTFMWPAALWHGYERVIRRAAGLGKAPALADGDHYDHMNAHCEVLVVGAGPAGLAAALAAARLGVRVMLVDEQHQGGGALLHTRERLNGAPATQWAQAALAELAAMDNVRILLRCTAFGLYRDNFVTLLERRTDHLGSARGTTPAGVARQRLWRLRAAQVVLATGAHERPLVFANNDRPGIMLASAVSTYVRRYAVLPGRAAVLFTNNDSAYATALDLADAGCTVRAVVDVRSHVTGALPAAVRARDIPVLGGHVVVEALGGRHLRGVRLAQRDGGAGLLGPQRAERCDLLAVSGGWSPAIHLHCHAGARPYFDAEMAAFRPGRPLLAERSAGAAAGSFALTACLAEGEAAGDAAARAAGGRGRRRRLDAVVEDPLAEAPLEALWLVPPRNAKAAPAKAFVDLQNDTTAADLQLAVREGFQSIEHVKRYTALGFGTDQGKLGNVNGMAIVAEALGVEPAALGTTTFRPPYTPVTFGAVAGRHVGALLDPVRTTAMHPWHQEHGAVFENVGQWLRPWYYARTGEDMHAAVQRECLAVRNAVGIMDASTLGKIDVRGADAAEFLERVYTNGWKKLGVGRARYGLMLDEGGMVMDDGVSARLAEDHFHMSTTTGGAATVLGWLERWLQTEWPQLRVYLTSVTEQWAVAALAGPQARTLLASLSDDIDLGREAFPFMAVRAGHVAGLPARVFRISFSGELAYEVNVAADQGLHLWRALMAAGEQLGITPYGTEAMHVLRAEKGFAMVGQDSDGSVTPADLGMDWLVASHKDFLGRRSLTRPDCLRADRKQLVGLLSADPRLVLEEGAQLIDAPFTRLPVAMVGHVSSSYWSPTLARSIALALVRGGRARDGETVYARSTDGRLHAARITAPTFYDPEGVRLRD